MVCTPYAHLKLAFLLPVSLESLLLEGPGMGFTPSVFACLEKAAGGCGRQGST